MSAVDVVRRRRRRGHSELGALHTFGAIGRARDAPVPRKGDLSLEREPLGAVMAVAARLVHLAVR